MLYSNWLMKDIEALGEVLLAGGWVVFVAAALVVSSYPMSGRGRIFCLPSRMLAGLLAWSLDSVWALALISASHFSLLIPEDTVFQFLSSASTACWPLSD